MQPNPDILDVIPNAANRCSAPTEVPSLTGMTVSLRVFVVAAQQRLARTTANADNFGCMSIAAEKVAEVLALPEQDRAFLAHQLIAKPRRHCGRRRRNTVAGGH
jgi:hypothetical protein